MTIRQVDIDPIHQPNAEPRLRHDRSGLRRHVPYPNLDLKEIWRSDYIDSTYNAAGVQDPAIDYLIDGIVANQTNEKALLAWGRALDRVLTWNYYVMPMWNLSSFRIAYWNKFSRPPIRPKYSLGIDSWWIDKDKEDKLPRK